MNNINQRFINSTFLLMLCMGYFYCTASHAALASNATSTVSNTIPSAPNTASATSNVQLAVWVNEAIITSYTLDHEHFLQQEKELAKYFTSEAWIDYSQALQNSNLPQQIKTNAYVVSAVATLPPTVKSIKPNEWEATMPILVIYKNPAYSQKQELNVVLKFVASTTQGVRGFAITSLKSVPFATPCRCAKGEHPVSIV